MLDFVFRKSAVNPISSDETLCVKLVTDFIGEKDVDECAEALTRETFLSLEHSDLRSLIPISGLSALKRLHIDSQALRDIDPISSLVSLEELWLKNTQMTAMPQLRKLKKLRMLVLINNCLKTLQGLETLKSLEELHIVVSQ